MRTLKEILANNHLLENRILQWRGESENSSKKLYISSPGIVEFVCFNRTEDYNQALLWEKNKYNKSLTIGKENGMLVVQYYIAKNIPYEMIYSENVL